MNYLDDVVTKFGLNSSTATGDTIWSQSTAKVDPVASAALYISSDDQTNDVGIEITVDYIDENGAQQSITGELHATDARTFIPLGVSGVWVNRAYVSSSGDQLTGNVYVSNDNTDVGGNGIPDSLDNVLAHLNAPDNQTMQAFYYIPNEVNGRKVLKARLLTFGTSLNGNSSNTGSVRLMQLPPGGSWRTIVRLGVSLSKRSVKDWFRSYKVYEPGTILMVEAVNVSASSEIDAQFDVQLIF